MKLWKILLLWALMACNEIKDCQLDPNREYATMLFYSFDSLMLDTPKKTLKALDYNGMEISTYPDVVFEGDSTTSLGLFLNSGDTTITYRFITDSLTYELQLGYQHSLFLYDLECPPTFSYKNLAPSSGQFDSILVVSPILKNDFPLNLEIYF